MDAPRGKSVGGTSEPPTYTEEDLVVALARDVIAEQAPHEMPLFDAISRSFLDTPESVLRRELSADEPLGFGPDTLVALTPFVLAAAASAVHFLLDTATQTARDATSEALRKVVAGWLRREKREEATGGVAALTPEQLRRVRDETVGRARQLNLDDSQATLLADAIVGRLATT